MVGRENTGLFYRSLYGEARFGAVRRIRLRRVAMGVEGFYAHALRRIDTAGTRARRYAPRLIMTSLRQSGTLAVKLNVTASPAAPAGVV